MKYDENIGLEKFKNLTRYLNIVGFIGGKPEKEQKIFKNLRQYVKESLQDELCPNPETFEHPVRENKPCPDWV